MKMRRLLQRLRIDRDPENLAVQSLSLCDIAMKSLRIGDGAASPLYLRLIQPPAQIAEPELIKITRTVNYGAIRANTQNKTILNTIGQSASHSTPMSILKIARRTIWLGHGKKNSEKGNLLIKSGMQR